MNYYAESFAKVLSEMSDDELVEAARDYIWLAEQQPSKIGRDTYTMRRDLVVAECERRGRMGMVENANSKTLKSERVRSISLPKMATEALEIHRTDQENRRQILATDYQPGDWICCVEDGSLWHPSAFTSAYRALLKRRKLTGPNFHGLRHSHASQMLKAGVDFKMISERLGHRKVAFTMDTYAHLFPGMDEEAARRVGAALDALGVRSTGSRIPLAN